MKEYKILIVDDEVDILNLLEKALNIEGYYNITKIDNGFSAVSFCEQIKPDIVILDIMLPGIDGYEVCKRIRQFSYCPILFLSSKNDELDKILGLAVGGDDYVTKPFRPGELVARIHAALRRKSGNAGESQIFESDSLVIDFKKRLVTVDGCEVHLTPTEYKLLELLVENTGKVLTHRYIAEKVWGHVAVEDFQFVRVTMANLRRKIEHDTADSRYILTETGVGYLFRA